LNVSVFSSFLGFAVMDENLKAECNELYCKILDLKEFAKKLEEED